MSNASNTALPLLKACAYADTVAKASHTRACSNASPCDICLIARQQYKQSSRPTCVCPTCKRLNDIEIPTTSKTNCSKPLMTPKFTASKLLEIKAQQNSSNIQIIKLASSIRSICGRGSVETGFRETLSENTKKASSFYSVITLPFQICAKVGHEDRDLVFCHDIEALVRFVLAERDYDPYDHLVRIGLDGGGGMFKIVVNIIDTTDHLQKLGPYQDTGVKRTIILAAVENIKETYENVKLIFSKLGNLDRVKFYICSDIKLLNIIIGIKSCASKHPCPYCDILDKLSLHDIKQDSNLRTINSIKCSASAYKQTGSNKKDPKMYDSCLDDPLTPGDDNEYILDICPPPELHLLLGIVKHVYEKMFKEWCDVALWLKSINVYPKKYQYGAFIGKDCIKILKSVDKLQQVAPLHILKYVHALRCLHRVVDSCFGMTLDPEYEAHIAQFAEIYLDLGISVTPKVHILIKHVPEFCKKHGRSLGWYTEQASESVHYDFLRNCWEKQSYKRPIGHQDYAKNLLDAVISYSSIHIV